MQPISPQSQGETASLKRACAYVAGVWMDTKHPRIDVFNPADNTIVGSAPSLRASDMRDAISAAENALPSWRKALPAQRADILMRWRDLILHNKSALAGIITEEQGKPFRDAEGEIEYAASFVRWFAEETHRIYGETIISHLPNSKLSVERQAIGVVGLITPWNFPSAMLTRKAAAALGAGCTAIAVPSMETPFSALALAKLAQDAGVPDGVFSVLTGDPAELVEELCANPVVRGISFTGSTEIGKKILSLCAPTIKRVSLELGGHAPVMVFDDVDVAETAKLAVDAKFQTSGQDCLAANRIYVHHSIYDAFCVAFAEAARSLVVGPGADPAADIGPLTNAKAVAKANSHVQDAVTKGARLLCGGKQHIQGGLFFEPTVLVDVTPDMAIMQEETFGPVAAITSFQDEAEAVIAANHTNYGLAAYVFCRDTARVQRIVDSLEYGMVAVNTVRLTGPPIPFGGVKQSGFGREGSRHGMDEYLTHKYVCLSTR